VLTAAQIEFDEPSHTYRVASEVWPSVTQILKRVGLIDGSYYTPESAYRGRVIAVATALLDQGHPFDTVTGNLHTDYRGYLEAYEEFRHTELTYPDLIEFKVYNKLLRYAGTIDRVLQAYGQTGVDPHVREIKTGGREAWHALQLQGYAECVHAVRRDAIYLQADGAWKLVQYDDPNDCDAWCAVLSIYNWKARHEC